MRPLLCWYCGIRGHDAPEAGPYCVISLLRENGRLKRRVNKLLSMLRRRMDK